MTGSTSQDYSAAVAIIGMSGRFPGAQSVEQFWENICNGVKSIRHFTDAELLAAGVDPAQLGLPNYVKSGTLIDNIDQFDAAFFGYPPREAEVTDPQHRLFMECAWEAFEQAGYDPESARGLIGVFAGSGYPSYMMNNLTPHPEIIDAVGSLQVAIGNERDSLASAVSYKLNLRGPAVAVQTFCSTSLVAVHFAYQSLITYECDMALAGGVAITFPQGHGYMYQEGGIVSPDGECRTFDARAKGSVMGNGLGVVVLKRLKEALADGDQISAVILGTSINNDGIRRVGYTAPGLSGQTAVIARGMSNAGVKPETISYIEAHGTATPLGDSIELSALIKAFQRSTKKKQFCAIGSVKPNIGHLDRASGVTGLIKTALALRNKQIPPSLNFESPSPDIDLANSPFFVNTQLSDWPSNGRPRRAGVNSFGLGGTNVHVVLEEPPAPVADRPARPVQTLLLSAKTETALAAMTANLAAHLRAHPEQELADVAHTLQVGRAGFNYRRALVARDRDEAIAALEAGGQRVWTQHQTGRDRAVAFLLPGVGEHYPGMARELYEREPVFKAALDQCCDLLQPLLGQDLRPLLFPADQPAGGNGSLKALLGRGPQSGAEAGPLHQTALAQPAVFAVEYALAQLLTSWGLKPTALLGYSLGEYVAACLAGVFSLEDALKLVATRAKLIQALPNGVMLAVQAGADALQPYLGNGVDLAAANTPGMSVLAGPEQAIAAVETRLAQAEIACRRIATSHAFHSQMLAPAAAELTALARTLMLNPPQTPYLSNVTGTWVTAAEATDPSYWARHMVQTVRFSEAVAALFGKGDPALLEVGPGAGLTALVRQHPACGRERLAQVVPTLPAQHEPQDAQASLLGALGKLWLAGVTLDWRAFYGEERRLRVALPTYPFERQRFWVDAPRPASAALPAAAQETGKKADIADWFYRPVWATQPLVAAPAARGPWLIFADAAGLGAQVAAQLAGQNVIVARPGAAFAQLDGQQYTLRPGVSEDYQTLLATLERQGQTPQVVLHLWSLDAPAGADRAAFEAARQHGFDSVVALAQALGAQLRDTPLPLLLVTRGLQAAEAGDIPQAEQGALVGLRTVIGQEYPTLRARLIDLPAADIAGGAAQLVAEAGASDDLVAYRGGKRLVQQFTPQRLEPASPSRLRSGGVYVITGGLGGVALILAEHLARNYQARLALVGRSGLPERADWGAWLAENAANDRTSERIRKVQALEAAGGQVLVLQADVADPAQFSAALEAAEARFGPINGVLHAAGVSDAMAFGAIDSLGAAQCEAHFQPKVYGLYALEQALAGRTLDFCLLFSSVSAVLGGLGLSAYAAANSFMDAFAQRHTRQHATPWISVNWDTWHLKAGQHETIGATVAQYEMLPHEGAEAFERVIATDASAPVVNSTGDLDARIRQWLRLESLQAAAEEADQPLLSSVAADDYEGRIVAIWQQVLGVAQVGLHDNFFDLGGNSLTSLQVIAKLKKEFKVQVPAVALFEAPTVSALAQYLRPSLPQQADPLQSALVRRRKSARQTAGSQDIAIVGMHGRFPGANSVEQFWDNLRNGVEALTHFSDAELLAAGVDPLLIQHPGYVKCRPVLDDVVHFDAAFFGYTPREAELMDPQQRLFHECAWEALELAGYDTQRFPGLVGVFAGANLNMYLLRMLSDPTLVAMIDDNTILENDKDALTTNVAYKLNLRGPSFAVQTFCSTSLVATHLACRSLQNGECDMALAGGVSVRVPVASGYLYQEGDQVSPDGHVRTFDAKGEGATFGDGAAVVVLKRLADAIEDGDTIHGVIKASAINNDGSLKIGYTAPSVVGQSEVVVTALERAGIDPTTIGYVEAHGTATRLGDPIEVASLTRAYRQFTDQTGYCRIGSVKPNVGHLDRAAGVTGLIKTVMAIKHGQIPATLHFESPNPEIDFESSPFVVSTALQPWPALSGPRRAAVNSLGVGGTNAHVIVEEAPAQAPSSPGRPFQLLLLSAKSETALEAATQRLHAALSQNPELNLADVAYTLQVGRRIFEHRRALVARDREEALALLGGGQPARVWTAVQKPTTRTVAFLLPGVGEHYPGMARALYAHEPVFQAALDRCCTKLQPLVGQDLRPLLFPAETAASSNGNGAGSLRALLGRGPQSGAEASPLHQTALAQPAVFAVEYALAQLLASWGVLPSALLGYSLGEYVAACLAGVLSLDDALTLVATRAKLIQALPNGVMLAVQLGADALQPYLGEGVELAAVNTPAMSVLAGPEQAIAAVELRLTQAEIACRRLATSHAFHSQMLAPVAEELTALARTLKLSPPRIPYLSNVTGAWITEEQATDPAYWATHMVQTVRFGDAVTALIEQGDPALLEVGPGAGLTALVRQHPACGRERLNQVVPTLPAQHEAQDAQAALLGALGKLWLLDVPVSWTGLSAGEQRRRIPLPTYPFERQRFWVDPKRNSGTVGSPERRPDQTDWFATLSWKRANPVDPAELTRVLAQRRCWVLFADEHGIATALAAWLEAHDQDCVTVRPGLLFAREDTRAYTVRPDVRADYDALLRDLASQGLQPAQVLHLWTLSPASEESLTPAGVAETLRLGFYCLLALAQALGDHNVEFCRINIVSNDLHEVTGAETLQPARATLVGPCKIIPQEYPNLAAHGIDIALPNGAPSLSLLEQIAAESIAPTRDNQVALRGQHRWVQEIEPLPLPATEQSSLRERGVYLITGGLGGIALAMAEHLASSVQARLVLLNRTGLPERTAWDAWLAAHSEDDRTSQRIRKVQAIEAAGGEVLVVQADVAQPEQVRGAVEQTLKRFGALHGVLHTAGVPGVGLMQHKTAEAAAGVFAPKVYGTLALAAALRDVSLDFLVLFSSITSATGGGPGQADYCGANAFLDVFAQTHAHRFGRTVAVSWGEWLWDAWNDGLQGFPEDVRAMLIATRRAYGLSFEEGQEALRRILARRLPHVFVTTQDLGGMFEHSRHTAAEVFAELEAQRQERPRYPRPTVSTLYAAPRTELEQQIAAIWQETLGIDQIGIDDNFFELGGNSLLGVSLIGLMRKRLSVDSLPAHVLYEAPSISAMAAYIAQPEAQPADDLQQVEEQTEKRLDRLDFFKRRAHTEEIL